MVIWLDLSSPEDVHRPARRVLEGRFHIREVELGADPEKGLAGPNLRRALTEGGSAERAVALTVCVPKPDRALCALVQESRRLRPELPILALTSCHDHQWLQELLASGVDDFSTHPGDEENLLARLWRLGGEGQPGQVSPRLREKAALRNLVGRSPCFVEILRRLPIIAQSDSTVLLTGETGTGKELVSRTIHHLSSRSSKPFVPVNCGALPVDLVENELFGHERAAFTGADRARPGLINEAEGGTLLLDEIDALPPPAQVKLLRFLQEREYRPLGSTRTRSTDVRLIAATNADVETAVADGRLRRDLYYRLNVLPLHLPALRHRREDIPLLARHFLARHARRLHRPCPALSAGAARELQERDWPGNARELSHLMERVLVLSAGRSPLCAADMRPEPVSGPDRPPGEQLSFKEVKRRVVERFERQYLRDLLRTYRGNITRASKAAQKDRRAFWELLRKHHIDAEQFRIP